LLNNKYDQEVERLMNEEGMTHAEAMAKVGGKKAPKKSKPAEGSEEEEAAETPDEEDAEGADEDSDDKEMDETISLPEGILPAVPIGKEVDITICGKVTGKSGGMIQIETRRMNCSVNEPMPEPKSPSAVEAPR